MSNEPSSALDPTRRFSNRVGDYVRYRPHYPADVLDLLRTEIGLTDGSVVADVGAGTGIATALFLDHGNPVYAVEPNREMRGAAERQFGGRANFHSVDGTAEATRLPDACVDLVVAAQAFHWFDAAKARAEFRRILRPGGWVVLMWNTRCKAAPFERAYERLLESLGGEHARVNHERVEQTLSDGFFVRDFRRRVFAQPRTLDYEALRGGLLSASYAPAAGREGHEEMLAALRRIFDEHQREGRVRLDLETRVYLGRV